MPLNFFHVHMPSCPSHTGTLGELLVPWSCNVKCYVENPIPVSFSLGVFPSFLPSIHLENYGISVYPWNLRIYQDNFLGIDPLSIPSKHLVSTFIIKDSKLFNTMNFYSVSLVPLILFHSHLLEHLYLFPKMPPDQINVF